MEEGITLSAILSALHDLRSLGVLSRVQCGDVSVKRLRNVMHLRQGVNATVNPERGEGINYELLGR